MATEPNGLQNITTPSPQFSTTPDPDILAKREKIEAFYKTYDVMTGVRIAATLSGFFGLMVILVLYKSKSKTEKALEDPDFTAAAVAEVEEEEERQLAAVLEASAYHQLNQRKSRRSLDISNMPLNWNNRQNRRFSSLGGYSSLMEPPTRTHSHLPSFIDEDLAGAEESNFYDDVYYNRHLDVPRRPSNVTCSSSTSSYLERRDSAVAIGGCSMLSEHRSLNRRRQSSPLLEIYDFRYPIDIKVIQPTPCGSPRSSNRGLSHYPSNPPNLHPHLAPLASISSCNSSLGVDYADIELTSLTSNSVFREDDDYTDEEIDEFSTDSDLSDDGACYSRKHKQTTTICDSTTSTPTRDILLEKCALPPPTFSVEIEEKSDQNDLPLSTSSAKVSTSSNTAKTQNLLSFF